MTSVLNYFPPEMPGHDSSVSVQSIPFKLICPLQNQPLFVGTCSAELLLMLRIGNILLRFCHV